MRNSSLVKGSCADNVTGLKPATDAAGFCRKANSVGEHSAGSEAGRKRPVDRAEVIMPARVTINRVKNPVAVSLRFPEQG